jgi:hypothetical protein
MTRCIHSFSILTATLLFCTSATANGQDYDIDGDGIADTLVVSKPPRAGEDPDENVPVQIQINYSSGAPSVNETINLDGYDASVFTVFPWRNTPGILVLNYTEISGRYPAEEYDIFKWEAGIKKLCLYAGISSPPADRFEKKPASWHRSMRIYSPCIEIGKEKPGAELEDKDYYQKFSVKAQVSIDKAQLYHAPSLTNKSKMYLVKGDKVTINEYKFVNENGWFLIDYFSTEKNEKITKWLLEESLAPSIR